MQILSSLIIFVASSGPIPTASYLSRAGALGLDAIFQKGPHENKVEGDNHLCHPAVLLSVDAAQDIVGFRGCKHSLLAHLSFHPPESQVLLSRATLGNFCCQSVHVSGFAQTQVQYLALSLVEPHSVLMEISLGAHGVTLVSGAFGSCTQCFKCCKLSVK